jgi:PBP1b-binding outer membrane lipoprotein LpoB
MKKISLILLILVFLTSCSITTNNNIEKKSNIGNQEQTTNIGIVENENTNEDTIELSPDEEKLVEDLLNF